MKFEYNELLPDFIIDAFYDQIKRCIDNNLNYDHYIRNLIKLNNRIPIKIQELLIKIK